MFRLMLLFPILMLAACTSADGPRTDGQQYSHCDNMDWYEIGRLDGQAGVGATKLQSYRKRCDESANPVKVDQYLNGREAGLIDFCTGPGGFEAGKNGVNYDKVCPENTESSFMKNYELGRRVRVLESENNDLDSRIADLHRVLLPQLRGGSVHAQIEQLENRRATNDASISDLEDKVGL